MLNIKKIGILRETKTPVDRRVPITPVQAARLMAMYTGVQVCVQPSPDRAFRDDEYSRAGVMLKEDLSDCDLLMGVKEVKKETLIPGKPYLFFAHVVKKQAHNREMFGEIIRRKITLIDYEMLTDEKGIRVVAFGRWAGIVGAYHAIRAWGLRHGLYSIPQANTLSGMAELCRTLKSIKFEPVKILITGEGRVAGGVIEVMNCLGAQRVGKVEFLEKSFGGHVYCQLGPQDYTRHKSSPGFDFSHFAAFPEQYESAFVPFTRVADLYISAHFWDPKAPVLIGQEEILDPAFRIRVVADISCDVCGPIISTVRASSIEDPYYDFNLQSGLENKAFSDKSHVTVMAVDNLPGEMPRDSSESFGNTLLERVFPALLGHHEPDMIDRATIVKEGNITEKYQYLSDFV